MALLGYALALLLLVSISRVSWIILVFPLWILLISIYILIENYRIAPGTPVSGEGGVTMIDPQARPASYFKLMALVVVLGVISALLTFAFIAVVNQGTLLIWEQAAQALGIDPRLFTTHAGASTPWPAGITSLSQFKEHNHDK